MLIKNKKSTCEDIDEEIPEQTNKKTSDLTLPEETIEKPNKPQENKPNSSSKDENNKADSANKPGVNVSTGDNIVYYFIAIIVAGIIMVIALKKNKTEK